MFLFNIISGWLHIPRINLQDVALVHSPSAHYVDIDNDAEKAVDELHSIKYPEGITPISPKEQAKIDHYTRDLLTNFRDKNTPPEQRKVTTRRSGTMAHKEAVEDNSTSGDQQETQEKVAPNPRFNPGPLKPQWVKDLQKHYGVLIELRQGGKEVFKIKNPPVWDLKTNVKRRVRVNFAYCCLQHYIDKVTVYMPERGRAGPVIVGCVTLFTPEDNRSPGNDKVPAKYKNLEREKGCEIIVDNKRWPHLLSAEGVSPKTKAVKDHLYRFRSFIVDELEINFVDP